MKEFLAKFAKAKKEIGGVVKKNASNPYFKSMYADLNAHLDLVEPVLERHGLLLLQPVLEDLVITKVIDIESANEITSMLKIPQLDDMQKVGGAITYARRYTLSALFALKAEDDDGETAVGRTEKEVVKKAAPKAEEGDDLFG